jgi:hypothetical protein
MNDESHSYEMGICFSEQPPVFLQESMWEKPLAVAADLTKEQASRDVALAQIRYVSPTLTYLQNKS